MNMRMETIGTTLVVKLKGEIDQSCTEKLRTDIDREIRRSCAKVLIFDFGGVSFMDSSGIGLILGRFKRMKEQKGKTMIIRPRTQVDKILELAGIKQIMECN